MLRFRHIEDFEGYRVGSDGSVWSCWTRGHKVNTPTATWRKLKQHTSPLGYKTVTFNAGNNHAVRFVHRLVLRAFKGSPPVGKESGLHLDDNPANNDLSNLKWGSCKENAELRSQHGRNTRGEGQHVSVLTNEKVLLLLQRRKEGLTYRELGAEFGISQVSAWNVVKGNTWEWLTKPKRRSYKSSK